MPITKEKKAIINDELQTALADVSTITFVEFTKLSVAHATELRRRLRDNGVGYTVAKKTLLMRALNDKGFKGEMPDMPGQTAIAYSSDPLAPAREVYAFSQEHKENIAITGGVYDGAFVSKEAMLAIATIPPLPVLRGQFVGMLISPIRSFVLVLDAIAKSKTA
jgi:large subunit ribosomal protein L10